jgi:hypothetical protein
LQIMHEIRNRRGLTAIESHWYSEESSFTRAEALRRGRRDLFDAAECFSIAFYIWCCE